MAATLDLAPYREALSRRSLFRFIGQVDKVAGLVIESRGPTVGVGDLCELRVSRSGPVVPAEVVGFRGRQVQLMAFGPVHGLGPGSEVVATHRPFMVPVGPELLGRVLDARGRPLDERPAPRGSAKRSVAASPPSPMSREPIRTPMSTGVRVVDGFLTCGRGQRVGIFSGSGVGKSTLLGMIARNTSADVNVIAMVGERGREVREFIETDLGRDGLERSVVVVATSDATALMRVKAALTAMTVAEYFRDQGKDVMFLMDSVTRCAMALREIGLAIGEPPTSRGYTPSVFAFLAPFLERAGTGPTGSITGFFTVLVEGDDMNDPIGDATRGILDGHIVLSRDLASRQHFPAVDVLGSVSRTMPDVVDDAHAAAARQLREVLGTYRHYEDLITVGAYRRGQNRDLDRAIEMVPALDGFMKQTRGEQADIDSARTGLAALVSSLDRWSPQTESVIDA